MLRDNPGLLLIQEIPYAVVRNHYYIIKLLYYKYLQGIISNIITALKV